MGSEIVELRVFERKITKIRKNHLEASLIMKVFLVVIKAQKMLWQGENSGPQKLSTQLKKSIMLMQCSWWSFGINFVDIDDMSGLLLKSSVLLKDAC